MEETRKRVLYISPTRTEGARRLAIWKKAQLVLGKRANDMLKELKKIRREWK